MIGTGAGPGGGAPYGAADPHACRRPPAAGSGVLTHRVQPPWFPLGHLSHDLSDLLVTTRSCCDALKALRREPSYYNKCNRMEMHGWLLWRAVPMVGSNRRSSPV